MGQLTLRLNAAWSLAGNSAYALSQWLLIVALARMASLETVGQFALALALTGPLFMAANMRLRLLQAADATQRFPFSAYFRTRVLASCLATAIAFIVAMLIFEGAEVRLLVVSMAVAKAVESLQDIVLGRFQQQERMDRAAASMLASALFSVGAFVLAFHLWADLIVSCVALALARACMLLGYDLPVSAAGVNTCRESSRVSARASVVQAGAIVAMAWPLGVAALMDSLTVNLPRYFIGGALGEHELGAFAALMQIALAGFVVVNAIGQSVMPRLARQLASGEYCPFKRLTQQFCLSSVLIGLAGVAGAWILGQWFLQLIYGPPFGAYTPLFLLIMGGAAFSYVGLALVLVLTAIGQRRVQTGLYSANVVVTAAGCMVLVPRYGVEGAAIAIMAAHAVQAVLGSWLLLTLRPWKRNGNHG